MRLEKTVETTQGAIRVREITPGHLVKIKEDLSKEMTRFTGDSKRVKEAQKALDSSRVSDANARIAMQTELLAAKSENATRNNLKLMQELPRLIRDLSGDCLVSDNLKLDFNDTPFSELQELWDAFKEVNASFLALAPVDKIAEQVVSELKSDLLRPKPSDDESENS